MSDAREEILMRIRAALADRTRGAGPAVEIEPSYRRRSSRDARQLAEELTQNLADYRAGVQRLRRSELGGAIEARCAGAGIDRIAAPKILAEQLQLDDVALLDERKLNRGQLEEIGVALTGCALAIAQTGTIVLDCGPLSGSRALTLLPDRHLCIVGTEQIVDLVPEAIERLRPTVATQPLTFISGPSATSDIELRRVEGVHGPRHLHVFIVS